MRSTIYASIHARGVGACTTVMLVRVDNYQAVFDGYGEDMAMLVDARVERVLRGSVRGTDAISRLAPATFSILLSDAPGTVAELVGSRLEQRLPDALAAVGFPAAVSLSVEVAPSTATTL